MAKIPVKYKKLIRSQVQKEVAKIRSAEKEKAALVAKKAAKKTKGKVKKGWDDWDDDEKDDSESDEKKGGEEE